MIFGGEALEPRSLEGWWRRHGAVPLVNMYGITETTVHVTYRLLGEAEILGGGGSVIGVPLRDLRVYVLDRWGEPVPVGVAGELHVGGAGVSLGYLNRPELTAERFVPSAFGSAAGERLYRAGDLARYLAERRAGVPGADRPPGQGARLPHRVGGDRERPLPRRPGVREAVALAREEHCLATSGWPPMSWRIARTWRRRTNCETPKCEQAADWQAVFEANYANRQPGRRSPVQHQGMA